MTSPATLIVGNDDDYSIYNNSSIDNNNNYDDDDDHDYENKQNEHEQQIIIQCLVDQGFTPSKYMRMCARYVAMGCVSFLLLLFLWW